MPACFRQDHRAVDPVGQGDSQLFFQQFHLMAYHGWCNGQFVRCDCEGAKSYGGLKRLN